MKKELASTGIRTRDLFGHSEPLYQFSHIDTVIDVAIFDGIYSIWNRSVSYGVVWNGVKWCQVSVATMESLFSTTFCPNPFGIFSF